MRSTGRNRIGGWLDARARWLFPGYFAFVMATGVISDNLRLQGQVGLSDALYAFSAAGYAWLGLLTGLRSLRFRRAIWDDLTNPRLVFSFFTFVAATDILGLELLARGHVRLAIGMWVLALVVWTGLIYFSFAVLAFLNTEHGAKVVHGGWLIAIVGTQSLVGLGAALAPGQGAFAPLLFMLAHLLWGVGLGLYGIFVTLFVYRICFFELEADDMTPLLWVVMGAAAISANAGSVLILSDGRVPFLLSMRPFIRGATLIMWAWATWWIPLLVLFGAWKHWVRRAPLRYTPMHWSLVFPLGMYALASLRLSLAAEFVIFKEVAQAMVWVALTAWAATAAAFVAAAWRPTRALPGPAGRL
ncbi:MAG: tellurite resistance/C4-dicarboxylate transporter family protein [Caulobacteraceae bacterium]